jgi:hypothetical protein
LIFLSTHTLVIPMSLAYSRILLSPLYTVIALPGDEVIDTGFAGTVEEQN